MLFRSSRSPLAIAPMGATPVRSKLIFSLKDQDGSATDADGVPWIARLTPTAVVDKFPKGVWAPRQDPSPVPQGEMLEAYAGISLAAVSKPAPSGPAIDAHQVEVGDRKPLPLDPGGVDWDTVGSFTASIDESFVADEIGTVAANTVFLGFGPLAQATPALRRLRRAPPTLAPLTRGLVSTPLAAVVAPPLERPARAQRVTALPVWEATLRLPTEDVAARTRTTVRSRARSAEVPKLDDAIAAAMDAGIKLLPVARSAIVVGETVRAAQVPRTVGSPGGVELRAARAGGTGRLEIGRAHV